MYRRWPLAALAVALALMTAPTAFGASNDPPRSAGWHGREIRDPLPQRIRDAAQFPRGWSAGSVGRGSGFASANGSRRVREVQRRLVRRGYRPGPVDGRFGARTRAAVIWFQTKHGLPRTGRVDARSVATLRETRNVRRTPATADAPTPPSAAQQEAGALATAPPATSERTGLALLAILIAIGLAAILAWLRAELRAARPADEHHAQLTAVTPPPPNGLVGVIGYVAVARGADRRLDTAAQTIGSWCEGRGWQLTQVVHDVEPASGRIADRPGLGHALDRIAAGRVAGLVVARLGDLTESVTELAELLQWLNQADAFVIALDYELDSSTHAGDLASGALMALGDWERGRDTDRTRPGLTATRPPGAPLTRAHRNDSQARWDNDPT